MAVSILLIVIWILMAIFSFLCINKRKFDRLLIVFFAVLLFSPTDALGIISGKSYDTAGIINISLAGYYVIISSMVLIIVRKGIIRGNIKVVVTLIFGIFGMFFIRFLVDGFGAASNKMADNYLLPVLLTIMIINELRRDDVLKVLHYIYTFISINAVLSCIEFIIGRSIFFHDYYMASVPWYQNVYNSTVYGISFRTTALLGHPLICGLFYVMGVVYLMNTWKNKKSYFSWMQLIILLFALYSTNSRSSMIILLSYILYYYLRNKKYGKFSILIIIAGLWISCVDFLKIYNIVFARDLTGSSWMTRLNAILSVSQISFSDLILGVGYNKTGNFRALLNMTSNFEISYLIVLVENGLIAFLIWVFLIFSVIRRRLQNKNFGVNVQSLLNGMVLCFLLISALFNSFADPGSLNYFMWSLFAFTYVLQNNAKRIG